MKKFLIGLFSLVSLLVAVSAAGQDDIREIQQKFQDYSLKTLQEKIYVHTDKSFYMAGEMIWFKIYDVDGIYNKPIDISKVAYLELVSTDQKAILQAKIELKKGSGNGSFLLPLSVNSGSYKIRAYTNWMKNFSADYFFEKPVTIINTQKKAGLPPVDNTIPAFDIHFFPEGGNMVEGLEGKVAFRVVGKDGKGVSFDGVITDQNNDTITHFQPTQFGIGSFDFTPAAGKKYRALLKMGASTVVTADLPEVYKDGYTLTVADTLNDQLWVTVRTTQHADEYIYLLAHTRQVVKVAEMRPITSGVALFKIDRKMLGEGISHLTIFNDRRQPVCERLVFRKPKSLNIDLQDEASSYNLLRNKVNLAIHTIDGDAKPEIADLSVSVFLADSLQRPDAEDIFSYLWLGSELNATIESPAYYFGADNAATRAATDNLMLTYGWRRFKWNDILKKKTPAFEFMPEYEGHVIRGKVLDKKTGLPVANIPTYLSVPGVQFQLSTSVSNANGQVQYNIQNFVGAAEIVVQTGLKDSNYHIDIGTPFSDQFSTRPFKNFYLPETLERELAFHSTNAQVQNAYYTNQLQKFYSYVVKDSTQFYGEPDKKFFLDEYTRFNTMEEVMREYITDVAVRKHQDKFHYYVTNVPYHISFEDDPLVLLDGVPVFDIDKIIAFDPLKTKKIEVVAKQYFLKVPPHLTAS